MTTSTNPSRDGFWRRRRVVLVAGAAAIAGVIAVSPALAQQGSGENETPPHKVQSNAPLVQPQSDPQAASPAGAGPLVTPAQNGENVAP